MNSADYKLCVNGQVVSASTPYIPPTYGATFANVLTCVAPLTSDTFHVADASCRYWGYENQKSCAYKDASGVALSFAGAAPCTSSVPAG